MSRPQHQLLTSADAQPTHEPSRRGEEEKTTRIFFQPGKLLTTNSLEPAIWRNMYYGYRDDVPKANPLHPNYVVEVLPTGKTVFFDSDIPKTFASVVQVHNGRRSRPYLTAPEITITKVVPLDGFLREMVQNPKPGVWPGRKLLVNTRFGMPTVYQVKEKVDEMRHMKSKSFMFRHDAQEQREDNSWIFKGLEQWPSSFIATIDFWPDEEFVCSVRTFPWPGEKPFWMREHLLQICIVVAWALKPTVHWPKEDK